MIKAKEFLDYLCNKLEFRLFTGVPCVGLKVLYNEINKDLLHYIPTVNEITAVGVASGTWLVNFKSGVIMDSSKVESIKPILNNINFKLKIPILFILAGNTKVDIIQTITLNKNYKKQLNDLVNYMGTEKLPSGILIKEDFLV